ncbi:hypothetical protein CDL15_Pgr024928 [Punica granatum]|uniref:Smr domain-containing protein n=1 Tax=Punica granatum TaxID=22663 RepID=A0A218W958_PUNGR|nr:hypothetical protein CDL15_Pgr024928 [Punica granatum]
MGSRDQLRGLPSPVATPPEVGRLAGALSPDLDFPSVENRNRGGRLAFSDLARAKGEEYTLYRKDAQQHWDSMKSSYQKGKKYSKMGQAADERASQEIFRARNKSIENAITIDLHGQHVKQAMRLLKCHLLLPSIQKLRVITGCGSHGSGKSKLKQMVIKLAQKEGIECAEENQGTVVMKLGGARDFSFLDFDSDSD